MNALYLLMETKLNDDPNSLQQNMEKKGAYAVTTEMKQEWREKQDEWYSKENKT